MIDKVKCKTCRQDIKPDCDYNQGRCPHRKPMIEIQPRDTSKGHFYVSLAKSIFRIGAGVGLLLGNILFAGFLFIFAELLGILEEMV